ncbi:LytTR family DNA-binding domain-containing protein [Clostridium celatum]|nr:LytTR family DNA-binding domain-containing protein [Clostridium celatum]MCE9656061.1 LytTR family transcriptional regulator [Clostridium celatum]MDU2266427.1 LytTR family DNA-binding domain-containing protein [Clostridium celatum]MDU3722262.1 LytTR family DNA-binding domain-containing protein [Clostridium celatum]MDU6296711.1 LytTR family DNA-binding domain-containing protein [Clostridium celatum]MDY3361289.1 LytTR family DNA-binding domain-containing protein [Clostridium celatum]
MKVSVHEIGIEKDEFIDLYIHEKNKSIDILIDYIENEKYASIKLSCYKKEEIFKIKSDDIYYIETSRDKLLVHTRNEIYEYKNRLYELEKILPSKFIRISKSTILNLEMVMSYNPMFNGLMEVKLNNLEITYISRKYLKEVRERIKGGIE